MKRKQKTNEQAISGIRDMVRGVFEEAARREDWSISEDFSVDVEISRKGNMVVRVEDQYKFVPLSFSTIFDLAEVFGTKKFVVNNYDERGCSTCDYGSRYTHEFVVTLPPEGGGPDSVGKDLEPANHTKEGQKRLHAMVVEAARKGMF